MKRGVMTLGEKSQYRVYIDISDNKTDLSVMTLCETIGTKFHFLDQQVFDSRNLSPTKTEEEIDKILDRFEKQIK